MEVMVIELVETVKIYIFTTCARACFRHHLAGEAPDTLYRLIRDTAYYALPRATRHSVSCADGDRLERCLDPSVKGERP